jgi:hypothetical protein
MQTELSSAAQLEDYAAENIVYVSLFHAIIYYKK